LPVIVFVTQDTLSVLDTERISDSKTVVSASAYKRIIEDQELNFAAKDGRVFDINTGSEWNSLGTAVNGPLKGKQLEPAETQISFAFVWLAFHPDSSIYLE